MSGMRVITTSLTLVYSSVVIDGGTRFFGEAFKREQSN